MSFFHKQYEQDKGAVEDGQWVTLREEDGKAIAVCVRSERSKKGRTARHEWLGKNAKKLSAQKYIKTVEQQDEENVTACVALISDWKGVTDRAGKDMPCTPETVREVCTEYQWFRDDVLQAAGLDETYRKEAIESLAKNSPARSQPGPISTVTASG